MNSKQAKADFTEIPIITVHKKNLVKYKSRIVDDIKNCSFVAVDCELSGLGERRKLNAPQVDERYRNTCLVAKTRSIISLGLSLFRFVSQDESSPGSSWSYSC